MPPHHLSMPPHHRFCACATPLNCRIIYGLGTSQLGDVQNIMTDLSGNNVTVSDFLSEYFAYDFSFIWQVSVHPQPSALKTAECKQHARPSRLPLLRRCPLVQAWAIVMGFTLFFRIGASLGLRYLNFNIR